MRSHGGGGGSSLPGAAPAPRRAEVKRGRGRGESGERRGGSDLLGPFWPIPVSGHARGPAAVSWRQPRGGGGRCHESGPPQCAPGRPALPVPAPGAAVGGRSERDRRLRRPRAARPCLPAVPWLLLPGRLGNSCGLAGSPLIALLRRLRRASRAGALGSVPLHAGLFFPSESCNESGKSGCLYQDLRSRIQARLQLRLVLGSRNATDAWLWLSFFPPVYVASLKRFPPSFSSPKQSSVIWSEHFPFLFFI